MIPPQKTLTFVNAGPELQNKKPSVENTLANMRHSLTKFSQHVECGAEVRESSRSRQELSTEDLLLTCKRWRRYSRETGPSKFCQKISHLLAMSLKYPTVRRQLDTP